MLASENARTAAMQILDENGFEPWLYERFLVNKTYLEPSFFNSFEWFHPDGRCFPILMISLCRLNDKLVNLHGKFSCFNEPCYLAISSVRNSYQNWMEERGLMANGELDFNHAFLESAHHHIMQRGWNTDFDIPVKLHKSHPFDIMDMWSVRFIETSFWDPEILSLLLSEHAKTTMIEAAEKLSS